MTAKIVIGGKEHPLRFGMSVMRAMSKVEGQEMNEEDAIIFYIWHGHLCYCSSRQIVPSLEYHELVDFVELAITSKNPVDMAQIHAATDAFNSSAIINDLTKLGTEVKTELDKKKLISQNTSGSLTENLD